MNDSLSANCNRCRTALVQDSASPWCECCWTYLRFAIARWVQSENLSSQQLPKVGAMTDADSILALRAELNRAWLHIDELERQLAARWKAQRKDEGCGRCSRTFTHALGRYSMPGRIRPPHSDLLIEHWNDPDLVGQPRPIKLIF